MRHFLPLAVLSTAALLPCDARAAGVVGTGTPASCTQAALAVALSGGGNVTFDCGTAAVTIQLTSEQVISASTTIDGGGRVTLEGQDFTRLFRVPNAAPGIALTIQGLRLYRGECPFFPPDSELLYGGAIVAGHGSQITLVDTIIDSNSCRDAGLTIGRGGAVSVSNGSLLLRRVMATQNSASEGGVVHSVNSAVTIEDSRLVGNSPSGRGAVVAALGGSVVFRRTQVFSSHAATSGGCIDGVFGPKDAGVTIEDSSLTGPTTWGDGGVIRQSGGALRISGSRLAGRAARGGGVFAQDVAEMTIVNSTFSDNHADTDLAVPGSGRGGAFYLAGANAGTISHSTITQNDADEAGGAFAGDGPSPVVLHASLLGANSLGSGSTFSPACAITLAAGPFDIQAPGQAADIDCASGILRADPRIEAAIDPLSLFLSFRLLEDSPAIDLVTSGCPPPETDQRKEPRPFGPACDSGSYELRPLVGVGDTYVLEGDGSVTTATFVVDLSGPPPTGAVTVSYTTADDTAVAGLDYEPVSGVLTFPPGVTQQQVTVGVLGDGLNEPFERFLLRLVGAEGAALGRSPGTCLVEDEDDPTVSVSDAVVVEGDTGSPVAQLTVSLSSPPVESTSAFFIASAGTALPDVDYMPLAGVVTFAPGVSTATVTVNVLGDTLDEPDERFYVQLVGADAATVADGEGVVTIQDDDGGIIRVGELAHGAALRSDLADGPDLYVVHQPAYSSWEVVVDEASGDLGTGAGPRLERLAADLTTVLGSSEPVGAGRARSLRWINVAAGAAHDDYIRVASQGCSTDCGPDDSYRVRAYETTLRAPRFNCDGGQASVLVLQNTGMMPVAGTVTGWGAAAAWLFSLPTSTVEPHGLAVLPLCATDAAAGTSGSLTVAHDGAYGQLVGKVVSADPATGVSFDTPLTVRPR
jgi:Calx-beta domain-containing protein